MVAKRQMDTPPIVTSLLKAMFVEKSCVRIDKPQDQIKKDWNQIKWTQHTVKHLPVLPM